MLERHLFAANTQTELFFFFFYIAVKHTQHKIDHPSHFKASPSTVQTWPLWVAIVGELSGLCRRAVRPFPGQPRTVSMTVAP